MQHIKLVAILVISFVIICINTQVIKSKSPSRKQVYHQYYKKAHSSNKIEKYVNKPIYPTVYTPEISDYFSSNARVYRAYNFDDFDYLPQESKITPNKLKIKPDNGNGGYPYVPAAPSDPVNVENDNIPEESKITPDVLGVQPDGNGGVKYPYDPAAQSSPVTQNNPENEGSTQFPEESNATPATSNEKPDESNGENAYPDDPSASSSQSTHNPENEGNEQFPQESTTALEGMSEHPDSDNGGYEYPGHSTQKNPEHVGNDHAPQESKITPDQLDPENGGEMKYKENEENDVHAYNIKKKPHKKGDKKKEKKEDEDCKPEEVNVNQGPVTTIFDKLAMLTDCIPISALNRCPQKLQPVCAIYNGFMQVFANDCTFRVARNEKPLEEFIKIADECCLVFWKYCTVPQLNVL